MFQSESYQIVEAAVYAHIAKSEQPPTVAHIKKEINNLINPNEISEAEAMNMILSAASNSLYNASEEFKKLPSILQKLVGSPRQLREFALMDGKTMNSVIISNLSRSYKVMAKREKEMQALPDISKNFIAMLEKKRGKPSFL